MLADLTLYNQKFFPKTIWYHPSKNFQKYHYVRRIQEVELIILATEKDILKDVLF